MKIFKNTAFLLIMAATFSLSNAVAFAEEAASTSSASSAEIISHIEKAIIEVNKSDFSAAQIHLKAARTASEQIAGNSEAAKKAHAQIIQGQIQAKKGDVAKANEELNKAISLYKAI